MFDQSYNQYTLAATLRKSDFRSVPAVLRDAFRTAIVEASVKSALSLFNGVNPITRFHLKKKAAYRIRQLPDELVVRKLCGNLKRITELRSRGRSFLITNLIHFLEEGLPYRVYRLDVKSFYESFDIDDVKEKVATIRDLTPLSKRHLNTLFDHYASVGGKGLPRGMALTATLSNLMMNDFDQQTFEAPWVYYYGRYVDDIVIVTNANEEESTFLSKIAENLPLGLEFSEKKNKKAVHTAVEKVKPVKAPGEEQHRFSFSYLGYEFSIYEPKQSAKQTSTGFRLVRVEIAQQKVDKIKKRIIRSFLDFRSTADFNFLCDRIRFLTSNFGIVDPNTGKRRLSGIFYSYPLLTRESNSLVDLDRFLRKAILSPHGRLFAHTHSMLSSTQKRRLLSLSFTHGHRAKHFTNFSPTKIAEIQECWLND